MSYTMRAIALTAVAVPALMFSKPAAAQGLGGSWEASIPTRMSNDNGVMTPSEFQTVSIVVEQRGDSVFATWKAAAVEGRPAPKERILKGVIKDGAAVLTGDPIEGRMNRNGEETVMKMDVVYTLKVEGDTMQGKMVSTLEGGEMPPQEREFKAVRKKA